MLELLNISKTYRSSKGMKTQALKNVSLKFPLQGMVFILGKSGSGKSTLLNVIGGLDQADEGELIIHGKSSKTFTQADYDAYRNTYIGFIFQEFYLMEEYTIEKNIALSLQLQQKEVSQETIEDMLKKVGLEGFANRYPNELSGGQKQRVAIARSLIKQPEILMADEPTGALDSKTGKEIFDTLKELSQEKLVIVVSHDEEAAKLYADRIITFADGEVIADSKPMVEADDRQFVRIPSRLPLKDCFHLGFTCLKHKKLRMIFTILLTSFALLSLSLSDSIGQFNGVNAQYKAMNENGEHLVAIQRQLLDEDGNVMVRWDSELLEIHNQDAVKLINEIGQDVAKVYESSAYPLNATVFQIPLKQNLFDTACQNFRLTEMNRFDDLHLTDVIGSFPQNYDETAISSYLADLIITYGIHDDQDRMLQPKSYEEVIKQVKLPIAGKWVKVSGIVKTDLSAYDELKSVYGDQIGEDQYRLYRKFRVIVNQNCEQLFVKTGFVDALNLAKDNKMNTNEYASNFFDQNSQIYANLAYPVKPITYFDGNGEQTIDHLSKKEVIWSSDMLYSSSYAEQTKSGPIYDDMFAQRKEAEREQIIRKLAKQVIGTTMTMQTAGANGYGKVITAEDVVIRGVILPDSYNDDALYGEGLCYAAKEMVEPYVSDPFYIGELLVSAEETALHELLESYPIDQEYKAHTIATEDVESIDSFAKFATKVFFYASIAFFVFAVALLMNFIVVSITYRKKEIGILRSIGARSMDVVKIFIWETVTLAFISYVVTIIALYVMAFLVNRFAMESVGILISPIITTWRQPLLLIVIVSLIALLSSLIPILKIAAQRPIDAIKK